MTISLNMEILSKHEDLIGRPMDWEINVCHFLFFSTNSNSYSF
jgi:hypothetical protein